MSLLSVSIFVCRVVSSCHSVNFWRFFPFSYPVCRLSEWNPETYPRRISSAHFDRSPRDYRHLLIWSTFLLLYPRSVVAFYCLLCWLLSVVVFNFKKLCWGIGTNRDSLPCRSPYGSNLRLISVCPGLRWAKKRGRYLSDFGVALSIFSSIYRNRYLFMFDSNWTSETWRKRRTWRTYES